MCWFLRRGENRSTRRKTSRSKDENQQQTQPTYDTGTGSRTRATLVGGERSHHCAIPAPLERLTQTNAISRSHAGTIISHALKVFYWVSVRPGTPRNTPRTPRNTPEHPQNSPEQPRNTPGTSHNTPEHPRNSKEHPRNTKNSGQRSDCSRID